MSGSSVVPLTSAETTDLRRFCGYPVNSSLSFQIRPLQGWSGTFDAIVAGLTDDQINVIRNTYLVNLNTLEQAIIGSSANADTERAAVWFHNPLELQERMKLFSEWRRMLCFFLGVPAGAGIEPLAPAIFTV